MEKNYLPIDLMYKLLTDDQCVSINNFDDFEIEVLEHRTHTSLFCSANANALFYLTYYAQDRKHFRFLSLDGKIVLHVKQELNGEYSYRFKRKQYEYPTMLHILDKAINITNPNKRRRDYFYVLLSDKT